MKDALWGEKIISSLPLLHKILVRSGVRCGTLEVFSVCRLVLNLFLCDFSAAELMLFCISPQVKGD